MKRHIIRGSVLAVVIALGIFAILRARSSGDGDENADQSAQDSAPETPADDSSPQRIDPIHERGMDEAYAGDSGAPPARLVGAIDDSPPRASDHAPAEYAENRGRPDSPADDRQDDAAHAGNSLPSSAPGGDPLGLRNKNTASGNRSDNEVVSSDAAYSADDGPALDGQRRIDGAARQLLSDRSTDASKRAEFADGHRATAPTEDVYDGGAERDDAPLNARSNASAKTAADSTHADVLAGDRKAAAVDPAAADRTLADGPLDAADAAGQAAEGTGQPGAKELEGIQAPQLSLHKTAPAEIQVGKSATFETVVKNTGQTAAQGVQIVDAVPRGTRLVSTVPPAAPGERGELVWDIGAVKPSESITVKMVVVPLVEGEVGSVASLHLRADAAARSRVTKPRLEISASAPKSVMIGEQVKLTITVSNPGSGAATGVFVEEDVPPGLKHEAGQELEYEIGTLGPRQTRQLELLMTAVEAGKVLNRISARGEANLTAQSQIEVDVLAPKLEVGLSGPKRRYLQRQATYTVSVSNPGTAAAKDVELITYLPQGMKFVQANNAGTYDAKDHAVFWSLEELPAARTGKVELTAIPTATGEHKLRVEGKAQQGLSHQQEETIMVEGIAALSFTVVDTSDPVEVGGEVTYQIQVVNRGTKSATNVRVEALLPPEVKPEAATGPSAFAVEGQRVLFKPLTRLAPQAEVTFTVRGQSVEPGDLRFRVQLQSDEMATPVTKEESTRVFSDQ